MFIWLSILGGLVILTIGAELLVRGASSIALKLGLSPLIIGLTIVAFGTSAPELAVSIKSAVAGNSGIALGNVIGSNIANIGLILGITALIRPIKIEPKILSHDIPVMIAASLLFWGLLLDDGLSFSDGVILASSLVLYLIYSYINAHKKVPQETTAHTSRQWLSMVFIISGIVMLVSGGVLFVDGAVAIAQSFGISELIIGLTVVAIGTSMPELVTSIVAALKGESDIAIGNVVGSNLFNILGILGVTALIHPIISSDISAIDWFTMIALSFILLPLAYTGLRVDRREGAILVLSYLAYISYLVIQA